MSIKEVTVEFISKYKVLNSGAYSVVFDIGSGVARKVGVNLEDPWLDFAELAIDEPSIHFPTIYSIEYFDDGYIATMEKLDSIPPNKDTLVENFTDYANGFLSEKEYFNAIKRENIHNGKSIVQAVDLLKQEILDLQEDETLPCYVFDMHYSNVMMRGEKLVIIDPFAHYDFNEVETLDEQWLNNLILQKEESVYK